MTYRRRTLLLTALRTAGSPPPNLARWFVSLKAGRPIGLPILTGYAITAVSIGAYLASTTLIDKTVDELFGSAQLRPV